MKPRFRFIQICCVSLLFLSITAAKHAPAKDQTLAGLKAAYIYNIAKFTRWPEEKMDSDSSPINLCLYGTNSVAYELESLHDRLLNSHPIRVFNPKNESDFSQCHILYISPTEKRRYRYILSLVDLKSVLSISDDTRFIKNGGLINLVEKKKRLRFEINQELLSKQELQLSSKLLKLAIMVDSSR